MENSKSLTSYCLLTFPNIKPEILKHCVKPQKTDSLKPKVNYTRKICNMQFITPTTESPREEDASPL